jgi:hypothetical protein
MKTTHLQKLKQVQKNDSELENTLVQLLTNQQDPLTFDELMECCNDKPPIAIKADIIYNIGFKYSQGKDGIEKDSEKAFKLYKYAALKKVLSAYHSCGIYLYDGRAGKKDSEAALKCLLHYYNNSTDKKNAVELANITITHLYLEKGNLDEALKYALQYYKNCKKDKSILITLAKIYEQKQDDKEAIKYFTEYYSDTTLEKDNRNQILPKILVYYFKQNDLLDAVYQLLQLKDINWDIVWQFIQTNREAITNEVKFTNAAKLLFNFPKEHANKQEVDEFAISILKRTLASLYPLADDTPATLGQLSLSEKQNNSNVPLGWTAKINATLLDGYDKDVLVTQILKLEDAIRRYEVADKYMDSLNLKLEEATEEGYSQASILNIRKEIKEAKNKRNEACNNMEQAKMEMAEINYAARRKEMLRQYHVQKRFFDPKRTHKSGTKSIAEHLQADRLTAENNTDPLPLHDIPTRRIITAERSSIEASKNTLGLGSSFNGRNQLGWINRKDEKVKLQELTIKYDQNPGTYPNHLGNYYIVVPGMNSADYCEILPFLQKLTQSKDELPHKENEKTLANLMLNYAKTGKPISIEQLQALNQDVTEGDTNAFNTVCYHVFVKEIARRMPSAEDKYDFPAAIITARAVKLITAGHLTLQDVFAPDAPYGVVTGTLLYNNHEKVKLKINRVNRLYNELIYKSNYYQQLSSYFELHPKASIIASRQQLRHELQETYGGNSDTDGEGYSSSEDNSPKIAI